jgi:hypothetical protein
MILIIMSSWVIIHHLHLHGILRQKKQLQPWNMYMIINILMMMIMTATTQRNPITTARRRSRATRA